jgi:hypothetical protein
MRSNGVSAVLLTALALALIPVATADSAVAPPACWKGNAGCRHTSTPHWSLTSYRGTVSVVGTKQKTLTCADVVAGPKEEIVAGRYMAKFALDAARSDRRIAADAKKQPTTSKPLDLHFNITSTTHEQIRTLTPSADPAGCTETFRDCNNTKTTTATDTLDVFIRTRRVIQETRGDFIQPRLLECAETPDMSSLLPSDALNGKLVSESSRLTTFRHRGSVVPFGGDHQIGDGAVSVSTAGKLTYARSIRACTTYPLTRTRCRTARG